MEIAWRNSAILFAASIAATGLRAETLVKTMPPTYSQSIFEDCEKLLAELLWPHSTHSIDAAPEKTSGLISSTFTPLTEALVTAAKSISNDSSLLNSAVLTAPQSLVMGTSGLAASESLKAISQLPAAFPDPASTFEPSAEEITQTAAQEQFKECVGATCNLATSSYQAVKDWAANLISTAPTTQAAKIESFSAPKDPIIPAAVPVSPVFYSAAVDQVLVASNKAPAVVSHEISYQNTKTAGLLFTNAIRKLSGAASNQAARGSAYFARSSTIASLVHPNSSDISNSGQSEFQSAHPDGSSFDPVDSPLVNETKDFADSTHLSSGGDLGDPSLNSDRNSVIGRFESGSEPAFISDKGPSFANESLSSKSYNNIFNPSSAEVSETLASGTPNTFRPEYSKNENESTKSFNVLAKWTNKLAQLFRMEILAGYVWKNTFAAEMGFEQSHSIISISTYIATAETKPEKNSPSHSKSQSQNSRSHHHLPIENSDRSMADGESNYWRRNSRRGQKESYWS